MPPGTLHFAHGGKRKLARGDTLNKPSRRSHPQIGGIRSVGIYGQLQHSTANAAIFSPRAESREPRAETRDPRPDPSAGICFISLKSGNLMCAASSIITGFQNEFPQPTTCRSLTPPPPPPPHCQVACAERGHLVLLQGKDLDRSCRASTWVSRSLFGPSSRWMFVCAGQQGVGLSLCTGARLKPTRCLASGSLWRNRNGRG